jgi:AcrR family transcriptional regulator
MAGDGAPTRSTGRLRPATPERVATTREPATENGRARRGPGRVAAGRTDHASAEEITRAALELVDREGIDALTMRALADEVQLSPRALYHHFSGKGEVIDGITELIWDEAGAEMLADGPPDPADWIVHACVVLRRVFLSHPDLAIYMTTFPRPGDRLMLSVQAMAAAVEMGDFDQPFEAFHLLTSFTVGSVALEASRRLTSRTVDRDPEALQTWAEEHFGHRDPRRDTQAAVMAALLPGVDDARFEDELRMLVGALRAGEARAQP